MKINMLRKTIGWLVGGGDSDKSRNAMYNKWMTRHNVKQTYERDCASENA